MSYQEMKALGEGECIIACEAYFKHRQHLECSRQNERIYEAAFEEGFRRGYALGQRKTGETTLPLEQAEGSVQFLPRDIEFVQNLIKFELKILDPKVELTKGSEHSAGYDIQAVLEEDLILQAGAHVKIPTGIALCSKSPVFTMVVPRSGLGSKGLVIKNTVGVIDPDYQGEIMVTVFNNNLSGTIRIEPYQRIGQLIVLPILQGVKFNIVSEFSETTIRGEKGFGSSGN